jgi:hypothetical protein
VIAGGRARAIKLTRLRIGRTVPVVIHPGELEAWARQMGHPADDEARSTSQRLFGDGASALMPVSVMDTSATGMIIRLCNVHLPGGDAPVRRAIIQKVINRYQS